MPLTTGLETVLVYIALSSTFASVWPIPRLNIPLIHLRGLVPQVGGLGTKFVSGSKGGQLCFSQLEPLPVLAQTYAGPVSDAGCRPGRPSPSRRALGSCSHGWKWFCKPTSRDLHSAVYSCPAGAAARHVYMYGSGIASTPSRDLDSAVYSCPAGAGTRDEWMSG